MGECKLSVQEFNEVVRFIIEKDEILRQARRELKLSGFPKFPKLPSSSTAATSSLTLEEE